MESWNRLVEQAQERDLEAFGELVRKLQHMAYGYAFSVLGDFHLAQDVAQEAFLEAYRALPALRAPEAFLSWFRQILFKHCDRMVRRRGMEIVPLEASLHSPEEEGPEQLAEENELRRQVIDAVLSLPECQRTVTTLYYVNGYNQSEIASFLEVPVTTVKKRLHDSRKKLKEVMLNMVGETFKSHRLPGDFADIIVRKASSYKDLKRAAELLSWHARYMPEYFAAPDQAEKGGLYMVGSPDQIEGAGLMEEGWWNIGGIVLKQARAGEMSGESEGVPDPAFVKGWQGFFKLAREKGIGLTIAHGSQYDHGFCNLVPSFYYAVATLPAARAKAISCSAVIREARDNGEREAGEQAFLQDRYATRMSAFLGGGSLHVVEQDGRVAGYLRVSPETLTKGQKYGMPFGYVSNITVKTREAALAVLKLAGELAEQGGEKDIFILESHMTLITRTLLSLGGTYRLRSGNPPVALDAEMVGIVDLYSLTETLKEGFQSRLEDSHLTGLNGAFSLEMDGQIAGFQVKDDKVWISDRKQKVHCIIPRWVATRLYTGYYSGREVLEMGSVPGNPVIDGGISGMQEALQLPEAEKALFEALFPKLWPCAMPDPDVWPWVMGEKHPRYRLGDREPEERKILLDRLSFPWQNY